MKNLFVLSIACLFVLVFAGKTCLASEPIKFGVAGVLSGQLTAYGISSLRGVELAAGDINAKGGIIGRPLKIIPEDDLCNPKEAIHKAADLVVKRVDAVVGHSCSGATKAALEYYRESNIIVISSSATNPALTQSGEYPNFFRTIAPDDAQAKVQINFVLNTLNLKKIAVLHDKEVYGKGLAEQVRALLLESNKADLVMYEGFSLRNIDFFTIIQKIKRSGADAVIYGGYHPTAAKIVIQMRKNNLKTVFISGDGVKVDTFIVTAGKDADGVYATAPRDTSTLPLAVASTEAYRRQYKSEPGPFFLNAYAATLALAQAIETARSTDYLAVAKALKTNAVETPIGKIRFDDRGDAIGVGFSIYQVQHGVFVELK